MPEKRKEVKVSAQQLIETYRSDQLKLDNIQRRQQSLQQILNEMLVAYEAIEEIKKAKKDENVMVSLGAGVYAEAKIAKTNSFKSSLAGNVLVDNPASKVLSELKEGIEKAKKDLAAVQLEGRKTEQNIQGIATLLQQGQRAVQQASKDTSNTEPSSVS
jgi:prefoldin alpha subunit